MNPSTMNSEQPRVVVRAHQNWALLTLANPPQGYFDSQCERELAEALDNVLGRAEVRVVVLTGGQSGVFVRHYDVGALERRGRRLVEQGVHYSEEAPPEPGGFHRCVQRITGSDRIFIAAINGACMGGGLELALACHLRYARDGEYLIGLPEVHLGLLPGAGGTQRLGRVVGHARALEMLLLGTCVGPAQAAQLDLVHAVVPDALAHAANVAEVLASRPPQVLRAIVRLHDAALRHDARGEAMERGAFAQAMRSPEALQAMADFNAGRRRFPEPSTLG